MAQTTLSVRMDENLKKQFDALCAEIGMNTSTAITVFAKAVTRTRSIPFELTADSDPFYSEANMAHLRETVRRIESGEASFVRKTWDDLRDMENE
jgi:DNA-damage-inducible protein J